MCKNCKSTGAFQWAFPCKKGVDTAENGPSEFRGLLQASLTNALEWYRSHFPLQMCFFRWNVRLSLVTKTYERDYWKNICSTSWILARWRQSRRACHSALSMAAAMSSSTSEPSRCDRLQVKHVLQRAQHPKEGFPPASSSFRTSSRGRTCAFIQVGIDVLRDLVGAERSSRLFIHPPDLVATLG